MTLSGKTISSPAARFTARGVVVALGVATAVALAGPASAQMAQRQAHPQQGVPSAPQGSNAYSPAPPAPTAHFSARTVRSAGNAMRDIAKINKKYTPEMQVAQQARNQKKMQEINQRAQHEAMRKLSADGISPRKYQKVMTAAQNDRQLRSRLMKAAGFVQKK